MTKQEENVLIWPGKKKKSLSESWLQKEFEFNHSNYPLFIHPFIHSSIYSFNTHLKSDSVQDQIEREVHVQEKVHRALTPNSPTFEFKFCHLPTE